MNRNPIGMAYEVRKGYSPENLAEWQKNERRFSCYALAFVIGAYCPLIVGGWMGINEKSIEWYASVVVSLTLLCASAYFIFVNSDHRIFRNAVCNALAGLELGVYHCADDLVIMLMIPWDCAEKIIDGQYDDWLKHKNTCKFMPN